MRLGRPLIIVGGHYNSTVLAVGVGVRHAVERSANRVDQESIRGFEGLRHAVERAEDQARSVEQQPLRVPRQSRNMLRPAGRMDRMLKVLAAYAAGVVCLAGCASTIALPTTSASSVPSANSPAADVRARMALVMGEQTYVVAKLTVAAMAGRKDEFGSYADLLAANGVELNGVLGKAMGETAGLKFAQSWTRGNSFFVEYMVAISTRQQDLADAALMNLNH